MLVGGLALVFWLPAHFGPDHPITSEAYVYGFNNRLSQLLFGGLLLALAVIAKVGGLLWPQTQRDLARPGQLSTKLLGLSLGLTAIGCAGMFWLVGPLGGMNDGAYFLDRIHLMERGLVPFRDFEFIYGVSSLHASLFLSHVLSTPTNSAYQLIWSAETLLGVLLLWFAIRWIDLPAGGKRAVFLLYLVVALLFLSGDTLNYCLFRYSLPVFAVTGLCALDSDCRASSTGLARFQVVAFAVAFTAILFSVSPEEAIVYGTATCLMLPVRRYYAGRPFVSDVMVFAIAFAALAVGFARTGAFLSMRVLSAGAMDLPVYPGTVVLALFASALGLACYLATGRVAERVRSNVAFIVVYGLGMLPGAMGRWDVNHLLGYGLPLFLCALLLLWSWPRVWRIAVVGFAVFVIAVPFWALQQLQSPMLSKAVLHHLYSGGAPHGTVAIAADRMASRMAVRVFGQDRGLSKMVALRKASEEPEMDPRRIFPGASPVVIVPFGYTPNKLSNYQAPGIDEGYFTALIDVLTPADVARKIAEMADHPAEDLVVSNEGLVSCTMWSPDRHHVRMLVQVPWVPAPRNTLTFMLPLCGYIRDNYHFVYEPAATTFGYGLMRRNP